MELNLPRPLPEELVQLAVEQVGLLRRDQLGAVSRAFVEAQLAALRWRELSPVLIACHNGDLNEAQQLWAGVLNADSRGQAGLAAWTGAAAGGLTGWARPSHHVLVRRGTLVSPLRGVAVTLHESRRFDPVEDLHPAALPPRTRIERSVLDAGAWSTTDRGACGVVAAAVQQRLTTATRLLDVLAALGAIRRRRLLSSCLLDIEGGAQAVSELDFLRFCHRHGLPRPIQQVVRLDAQGRRRYLDALLIGPNGKAVPVEIDGALHLVALTYWSDMSRDNELWIQRSSGLRFPSYVIRADDPVAVDQLCRALGLTQPAKVVSA